MQFFISPNPQGRVAFLPLVRIRLKCRKPKDYHENPKSLGEHIRKRRMELGLTQRQAAEFLSVNPWTVLNWEAEHFRPPAAAMPRIVRFLGYNPYPVPTDIPGRLREKRRENGWSTRAAARQLGVDPGTWRDWEAGGVVLHRRHRAMVAALLGCDLDGFNAEMQARWNTKHASQ